MGNRGVGVGVSKIGVSRTAIYPYSYVLEYQCHFSFTVIKQENVSESQNDSSHQWESQRERERETDTYIGHFASAQKRRLTRQSILLNLDDSVCFLTCHVRHCYYLSVVVASLSSPPAVLPNAEPTRLELPVNTSQV